MKRQHLGLTVFLLTPVVAIVVLVWAIADSLTREPVDRPAARGAGAGATGGANALGEALGIGRRPHTTVMIRPESLDQGFTLVVTDASAKASPDSPIFVATNAGGWQPGLPAQRLEPQADGRWMIRLSKPPTERLEFKFTRGSWQSVELSESGGDVPNRTLPEITASSVWEGNAPVFEFTVASWADATSSVVGRLDAVTMPSCAGDVREVLVWLPPGYDAPENAQRQYDVLYMHDGQNLFDRRGGSPGEWRLDETATRLIEAGTIRPLIIVGLPHGMADRIHEYLPPQVVLNFQGKVVEARGDRHLAWLVGEVMPRINRDYRTLVGPEHTGVGGSSLGGAISLYATIQAPEAFGLLLAESLPPQTALSDGFMHLLESTRRWPVRAFVGAGGRESGENEARNPMWVDTAQRLDRHLELGGLGPDRRLLVIDPEAGHNEAAWAARVGGALEFLFPPATDSAGK